VRPGDYQPGDSVRLHLAGGCLGVRYTGSAVILLRRVAEPYSYAFSPHGSPPKLSLASLANDYTAATWVPSGQGNRSA
jgi:hypothetical protein